MGGGGLLLSLTVVYMPSLSLLQSLEPFEKEDLSPPLGNRVKFGCYTFDNLIFVSKVSLPIYGN